MTSTFPLTQVHVTEASSVADHCTSYALSDPENLHFRHSCSHPHNLACCSCEGLKSVLSSIEAALHDKATTLPGGNAAGVLSTLLWLVELADMHTSSHRAPRRQDKCHVDILQDLNSTEVLITQDWAMKFLPQKYWETQTDWYGKRGIRW